MARLAILTLFMGQTRNRFLQYQEPRTILEILDMAGRTEDCEGVELRYPGDLADPKAVKAALERNHLGIAAINFASVRPDRWLRGAWSSTNPAERRAAVDDFKRCIDLAREIGAPRITNCPLNDGIDYAFELDFVRAYDQAAECYAEIADHDPSFPICIEYKISEPRVRSLLGNAGETAAFCQIVNRDNLGVTLDVGHALIANENASQSAALLAKARRLFYVHLNDNDGRADWDLLPGAVHPWELVEFLWTLGRLGYDDWMTFDIVPKEAEPVEFFATAARLTRKYEALVRRIDAPRMEALLAAKNPSRTLGYVHTLA
jgi:xylose isomerase